MRIKRCDLPDAALLSRYQADANNYTDCYRIELDRPVSLSVYIEAFYTTWLFKLERRILARMVNKPSTDEQARALARGQRDQFAAWTVEARCEDQILMCDFQGRTRSWLMVQDGPPPALFFGSAVVASEQSGRLPPAHRALLGFHRLYSRMLLSAAESICRKRP